MVRQPRWENRKAVSGANTVLDRPATSDSVVRGLIRSGPYQRVSAAKAGGYSSADWAKPASAHAAMNHGRLGAAAIASSAPVPSTEPAVITRRGPWRSRYRPTGTPNAALAS